MGEHFGTMQETLVAGSRVVRSQPLITQEVIMELVLSVRHYSGTMELQKTNSLSVLIGLQ